MTSRRSDLHEKKGLRFKIQALSKSKNSAVLEPRTGHFRGLGGFEAKFKDLTFHVKAKDFKLFLEYSPCRYLDPIQ